MTSLSHVDADVHQAIIREIDRQQHRLILIASETLASQAVMEAQGSLMTNKYAEGYPGRRYYGGCENVDIVERLAIERAKQLFGADHVNVQPHSGSSANMAAYLSVLKPGDPILGMDLPNGGHLTHGHPVNFSGILFQSFSYGVDRNTQLIDYDVVERIAKECRPKMIVVGASAYAQTLDFKRFRAIATSIGAYLLADIAHIAGLVAAGLHPSPIPHADFVTTTTHKTLRGPRGGIIMCRQEFAKAVDKAVFPGLQGGPLMHVIAAKAVALKEAQSQNFRAYQQQVITNAKVLAGELRQRGYTIVSGDTDTHLFLVDLSPKGISGKAAELALDASGITVNKNTIPYDPQPPAIASGIRLGTPIVSSQGMGPSEMALIAALIDRVIGNLNDPTIHETVKLEIQSLCGKFPNKRLTT